MMTLQRVIGRYSGTEKGPLIIALGGMHGNEPAGIQALELMFKMLEVEPITNPRFTFKGRLLGLRGNLQAIATGQRFLEKDLNRQFTRKNIERVLSVPASLLQAEDRELHELVTLIQAEIAEYQPPRIILLDLHTTTAQGGIFAIPTAQQESIRIALEMHAPVITGLLKGLKGTTLHYFVTENMNGIHTVGVCFESGQHRDPLSVNRAIAALTNCLRSVGCVQAEHIENQHDRLLIDYSKGLPAISELLAVHSIQEEDQFIMRPNYQNFQPVEKGEVLAEDRNGPIRAAADGLILMPLYQPQGEDGFFLIRKLIEY